MVTADGDGSAPPAIVNQGVNSFLQHPFFITDDNFGRAYFYKVAQSVVTIYDSSVEVIKVAGGESPSIQLNHGPEVRR